MEAQPDEGDVTMAADPAEGSPENPRLMISKIVCTNFKSYAGVKELGPFHKCFTSIVGPNGSGKSNVIDAMLFVFGYRARKIRSKKISVLIHSSEQYRNLESCTVAVHFQHIVDLDGDEFSVVPRSQFVVSRTAHKDGSSFYSLDNHRKPFKEIATLLRENGIDLDHNRFLILQGEVEQIALMKPKAQTEHDEGMLEFLEDIIGTSKLKEPIEEMGKKVEELNEARGEKLNRVKAVEKEKAGLEGAKNEAEEYLGMQTRAAQKHHSLYQRYIHECGEHELKARERKEELEAQAKEHETVLAQLSADKKEKSKAQKKDYRVHERLVKGNDVCKESMATCEQRDVRARQDVKNARVSQKKIAKNLEKEKSKSEELRGAPEKHGNEIKKMESKLGTLEARKEEEEKRLVDVMESLKTATVGLQQEKEKHETQLIELKRVVNDAKSKLDVAQAELDIYREKHTRSERQLQESHTQLQTVKTSLKENRTTHSTLQCSLPAKKQRLSKSETELKTVTEKWEGLRKEVGVARETVDDAKSSMQANRSRGQVLKALMEQRDSGAIPGIHGRLGDLGAIDEKYDVAISTACRALDHIVVDSMDTAMKCVEFLKKRNVGLATFIGLDKIEHLRKNATSKISTPESVPRLFDLVRPKDLLFSVAFFFALRNTLVASDLDQATRIGLQGRTRHRVVTLGGQLIDTSGAMSGGGGKVMKGGMSSRIHDDVSPQQLTEMENLLTQKEKALEGCSRRKVELEEVVKGLKAEVAEEEVSFKKAGRAVEVLSTQQKALEERLTELERERKEVGSSMDAAHLKKLETQVKAFEKEHTKAAERAGQVESEVKRLHEEIMEVGGARLKPQQAMVDKLIKEIDDANGVITKARVGIKTNERDTKKCSDKISSLEKDLAATQTKLEDLKGVLTQLEEEATEIVSRQKEIEVELKGCEEVLKKVKGEIEIIEGEETQEQAKLMDVKHELEKYVAKMKENQQKIRHFQNEMKKLDVGSEEAPVLSKEELEALDKRAVEYEITMLEERMKQMTPNMAAIEEYRRKEELHSARLAELDSITGERDDARKRFEELRKQRLDQFMTGFSTITYKLKEMYQMITLGGDAELELVDSLDPFSEGIVFSVRPPKKSWKNISNLSGGEKTLSSLALVFALHHYKPSPLYVMDEIDAALDFKNVSIVAHYIKERTKNAQFIIISLRNNMFELADRLVGIYKTDNCTKSVTINPQNLSIGGIPTAQSASTIAEA